MSDLLPKGWVETTLGEVIEIKYGKDHKKLSNGKYPLYGSGGIMRYVEKPLYNEESILIPRKGTLTNLFYINKPFWCVDTIFYSKINKNKVFPLYLFYKLKTKRLAGLNVGSAVPSLTTKVLNQLKLQIPQLPEQKAIADILSSFDDKIELLREQNKVLEKMGEEVFKEWFSKKNSNMFEYNKLDKVVNIGSSKRIFHSEYVGFGVQFYRSKEIIELSSSSSISTELFITQKRFNEIKKKFSVPIRGDILLTSVGTIGVPYQVRGNSDFYFKDGNLTWFRDFSQCVSSDYVYAWLKLRETQYMLKVISIGSTQKALTISNLKNLNIPIIKNLPHRKLLFDFLRVNNNKINHNYLEIDTLIKTRDILLPKLMKGEIRVEDFNNKEI